MKQQLQALIDLWSPTRFEAKDLCAYAERSMVHDTRRGVYMLSSVSLLLLAGSALVYALLGFDPIYVYTCAALAVLSLHMAVSARAIRETRVLHLLGMTLLVVSGMAFVLVAHEARALNTALFASVVLLFMVIPLVPWGLREATIVVLLIYLVFTLSTLSVQGRFDSNSLWLLQFFMLGAGFATLSVIGRGVAIRRHDIETRYALEDVQRRLEELSYKDPLTGAWNRRFLDWRFPEIIRQRPQEGRRLHFALIDVDNFKQLNDYCGHDYGDLVLQRLVAVFTAQLAKRGYMVRVGGDEFVLLFHGRDPEKIIRRSIELLERDKQLVCDCGVAPVQISTGLVSLNPGQPLPLDNLYRTADQALYRAKSKQGTSLGRSRLVSQTMGTGAAV